MNNIRNLVSDYEKTLYKLAWDETEDPADTSTLENIKDRITLNIQKVEEIIPDEATKWGNMVSAIQKELAAYTNISAHADINSIKKDLLK